MIKMGILAAFFCTIILYFLSAGCYFVQSKSASKTLGVLATTLAGLGLLANTLVLLLRIMLTGQGPFSSSVEFLVLLSWLCTFLPAV